MADNAFLDLYRVARTGRRALLVTVVRTVGPSYRPLGSSAVVLDTGSMLGAISGGCLEADVIAVAEEIFAGGAPQLLSYDTGGDEDLLWGTGSGCGGRVDLLVAPVAEELLTEIAARLHQGQPTTIETVIAPGADLGQRQLLPDANETAELWYSPDDRAFCQVVQPPATLIICGAGSDGQAVARLAAGAAFRVIVADHRPTWATPDRFPEAEALVVCAPGELPQQIALRPNHYALILTHQYQRDMETLQVLLEAGVHYIGLLGARQRSLKLVEELTQARPDLAAALQRSLRAPVGLDIGPDGPQEIALSIVSELVARRAGKSLPVRSVLALS